MKIGYARLGRIMTLNEAKWGVVGGDCEPPRLLDVLARRHPDDQFYLLGRTSPEDPAALGFTDNVVNPWIDLDPLRREAMKNPERNGSQLSMSTREKFVAWVDENILPLYRDLDAMIVWLGQHGSVHSPGIPKVNQSRQDVVTPQDWAVLYGSLVIRGINAWRDQDPHKYEETWLVTDPRNYLKMHDLKWPLTRPILGQYEMSRDYWVHRYDDLRSAEEAGFSAGMKGTDKGDHTHWKFTADYVASGLEIGGVLPQHVNIRFDDTFERTHHFGMFMNETRATSGPQRPDIVRDWVRFAEPDWIHGKWTDDGLRKAGVERISPVSDGDEYFGLLRDTRCTFTTPASGTGWATAKPWEAFAAGCVCFRYPGYDAQDHIYGKLPELARDWLSPKDQRGLIARLRQLKTDESAWRWLIHEQRRAYDRAVNDLEHVRLIEERTWKQ